METTLTHLDTCFPSQKASLGSVPHKASYLVFPEKSTFSITTTSCWKDYHAVLMGKNHSAKQISATWKSRCHLFKRAVRRLQAHQPTLERQSKLKNIANLYKRWSQNIPQERPCLTLEVRYKTPKWIVISQNNFLSTSS